MRKVNQHIGLIVLTALVFVSCEDFLITESPSELTVSSYWNTSRDAEQGVAAVYDAMQTAYETNFWRWAELRADNYMKGERPDANQANLLDNNLTINIAGNDWGQLYIAIAKTNDAIENIPNIPDFSGKNNLLAQLYALRAFNYFWATRVWGDVPKLVNTVKNLDEATSITRSPISEIYNEIILPDLQKAEELVSIDRSLHNFSLGSILALKAHIYMWPGQHQNFTIARDAITRIQTLGYTLETTQDGWINNIFRESRNSSEIIFSLKWDFQLDGSNGGLGGIRLHGLSPQIFPAEILHEKWMRVSPNDFRMLASASFDVEIVNRNEFPYTRTLTKYSGAFADRSTQGLWLTSNDMDIIFFRLSDMILLKAEAELKLNNPSEAMNLVNTIRNARGLESMNMTGFDEVLNAILDERQFELMGEGHRFWDLVRNEKLFEVMEPINGMSNPNTIYWPVSQNVLNRNPKITQTPGYN